MVTKLAVRTEPLLAAMVATIVAVQPPENAENCCVPLRFTAAVLGVTVTVMPPVLPLPPPHPSKSRLSRKETDTQQVHRFIPLPPRKTRSRALHRGPTSAWHPVPAGACDPS